MRKDSSIPPENAFLDKLIKRAETQGFDFIVGSAVLSSRQIIYSSDGFTKITGYPKLELRTQSIYCNFLFGEHTNLDSRKEFDKAVRNNLETQLESVLYKKDGRPNWFLVNIAPVRNENLDVVLCVIALKDITHRKDPLPISNGSGWERLRNGNLTLLDSLQKNKIAQAAKATLISNVFQGNMISVADLSRYAYETPVVPRFILPHYSTLAITWDWIMFFLTMYNSITIPFTSAFSYQSLSMDIMDLVVDIFFITDIVKNFRTTIVDEEGQIIWDTKELCRRYLKFWFLIDLASSIPMSIYTLASYSSEERVPTFRYTTILKMLRLVRLSRVMRKMDKFVDYGITTLILLMLIFCICAHWMACSWYAVSRQITLEKSNNTWLYYDAISMGQSYTFDAGGKVRLHSGPDISILYMSSLYYAMTSLSTCGFGNISASSMEERALASVFMLLGCLLYAVIFGQVSMIMQYFQQQSTSFHQKIKDMMNFCTAYKVPQQTQVRMVDYFNALQASSGGADVGEILKQCSSDIQAEICLHLNRNVFNNVEALSSLPVAVQRSIARHVWSCRTGPCDRLVHNGERIDAIYILGKGSVEAKQGDIVVALMAAGDIFGMNIFETEFPSPSLYDVYALSDCELHWITRADIGQVMELYPEYESHLASKLLLSFDLTKKVVIEKTNDILKENDVTKVLIGGVKSLLKRVSGLQEKDQTKQADVHPVLPVNPLSLVANTSGAKPIVEVDLGTLMCTICSKLQNIEGDIKILSETVSRVSDRMDKTSTDSSRRPRGKQTIKDAPGSAQEWLEDMVDHVPTLSGKEDLVDEQLTTDTVIELKSIRNLKYHKKITSNQN